LQVTLGHVVERRQHHVRLLYDLLNGTTLTQKIVVSSVLPLIEIITIKEHKLDSTFLHVIFGSQSLLNQQVIKPALISSEGAEKVIRCGVNESQLKFIE
jgi:hypothetical protein